MPEYGVDHADTDLRVRNSFAAQAAMKLIGAEIHHVQPGRVEIIMPFRDDLTQQNGFLHAGIVSAALDSACGYAAMTLMPPGADVLTIEFKVNLLAPAKGDHFLFRGEVTKPGRTIMVSDGRAYAVSDGNEKLIVTMTGTMMVMADRGNS